MSKELIVSSTRHETRVAILEDDQLVEIFHQREKEYSLAGSIHKGRVTRVLPGMQSAFVDIGLERDAFLYVSDFFEDNEEYDKIVSGVEEKVLKLEKGGANAQTPIAITTPIEPELAAVLGAVPGAVVSPPSLEVNAAPPPKPDGEARRDNRGDRNDRNDRNDRGGRGRRGRRRRPSGGGLPESKFFTPREGREPRESRPEPPVRADGETEATGGLTVLPGESISKYVGHPAREVEELTESTSVYVVVPDENELGQPLGAFDEGDENEADIPSVEEWIARVDVSEEPLAEIEDGTERMTGAASAEESLDAEDSESEIAEDVSPELELTAAADADTVDESEAGIPVAVNIADGSSETEFEEAYAELETVTEVGEIDLDAGVEAIATETETAEGPEPARIPQSLTAALREQGDRIPHRSSRRSRRRSRGDRAPQLNPSGGVATATQSEGSSSNIEEATISTPRQAQGRAPREEVRPVPPSIAELLRPGQEIIVQIAKEPLGQKGARITSHIALPGRFLVYMPTVDHIGVSRKIPSDEERQRLKRILQTHRQGIPGGYIVRTAGENRSDEELRADMMFLYNLWLDMRQKAEKRPAPQLLHHDLDVVERILRDQLTSAFKTVYVDNELIYESVLSFAQRFQPAMVSRIKLYTRPTPIFDEFGITQELEKALRPKVWLKSGGYIVINQTEALVAIDINTGKYVGKSNRLEDTIVKINSDAIKEIVRQIRLRDLGGIIVVDFIDMDERKNRQKVMQALEESMRVDRAPYKILQFNDFGLVAITRKRVKQSLERTLCCPCPYCEGAGYVKSVQTVINEILQEAQKIAKAVEGDNVMLRVNPEVAKVLKSNSNDSLEEIESVLGKTLIVKSDPLLHQTKFDLA